MRNKMALFLTLAISQTFLAMDEKSAFAKRVENEITQISLLPSDRNAIKAAIQKRMRGETETEVMYLSTNGNYVWNTIAKHEKQVESFNSAAGIKLAQELLRLFK